MPEVWRARFADAMRASLPGSTEPQRTGLERVSERWRIFCITCTECRWQDAGHPCGTDGRAADTKRPQRGTR
jgi:hypothetical protein